MDEPKLHYAELNSTTKAGVYFPVYKQDDPAIVQALAVRKACHDAGLLDENGKLRTFTTTTISWHEQEHVVGVTCPPFHKLVHFTVPIEAAERAAKERSDGVRPIRLTEPGFTPEETIRRLRDGH